VVLDWVTFRVRQAGGLGNEIVAKQLLDVAPSAKNIRTTNNLDVNTSEGEFYLSAPEYRPFEARLYPYILKSPYPDWEIYFQRKIKEGYDLRQYTSEGSVWVFLCSDTKAHCEYRMWVDR
jgi:hypothetical protein